MFPKKSLISISECKNFGHNELSSETFHFKEDGMEFQIFSAVGTFFKSVTAVAKSMIIWIFYFEDFSFVKIGRGCVKSFLT